MLIYCKCKSILCNASDEVSYEYRIRSQIARRNLTVAERIRLAEKSRPAIEKAARERQAEGGRKGGLMSPNKPPLKSGEASDNRRDKQNETDVKLAKIAGVGADTYRKGKRVLDSDNQEIIDRMAKGELSVNAAYKAIMESERQAEYHWNQYEKSALRTNFGEVQKYSRVRVDNPVPPMLGERERSEEFKSKNQDRQNFAEVENKRMFKAFSH